MTMEHASKQVCEFFLPFSFFLVTDLQYVEKQILLTHVLLIHGHSSSSHACSEIPKWNYSKLYPFWNSCAILPHWSCSSFYSLFETAGNYTKALVAAAYTAHHSNKSYKTADVWCEYNLHICASHCIFQTSSSSIKNVSSRTSKYQYLNGLSCPSYSLSWKKNYRLIFKDNLKALGGKQTNKTPNNNKTMTKKPHNKQQMKPTTTTKKATNQPT